ncbi:Membrane protein involved in the export of O-antigen and teichoic acid [Lachnospiraceae bacterium G41]|nr:Membrane protein involved in the export of O-antigen and teichoic acid [Lachnospiraceae bacterium G41]
MSREKELVKNTVILSIGTYLPKLTSIITLPILTGFLTRAELGTYDLITTLVSLLLPALTLQIQSAAFRFLISCRNNDERSKSIISNIFAFTIPISLIGLTITFFCLNKLTWDIRWLIVLYFFFDIIYIGCGQVARGIGKNLLYASSAGIVAIINMCGIVLTLLIFDKGLKGILLSLLLSNIVGILLIFFRVKLYRFIDLKRISLKNIRELLAYSWPMVPNALSNWVLSLSDRLVILGFLGVEINAVYAVANKIPNLVKTFQGTFTSAWQENASITVDDSDSELYYSNMLDSINNIVVGIVASLIALTPILFKILIRGDYEDAYLQMPLLCIGMYFSCMAGFIGGIYIAHMKTKSVGLTTVCAAAINLIIDLIAMQKIGLYAASLSTLGSYGLLFIFRLFDVQKFQPLKVKYFKIVSLLAVIISMSVVSYIRIKYLDIINGIIGITFAVLINKELVEVFTKKTLRKIIKKKKE